MKLNKVSMLPMYPRAIVSASGTLLFDLGVQTDSKLQPFAIQQRAYFKSSQVLKTQLDDVVVPPNSFQFTSDAVYLIQCEAGKIADAKYSALHNELAELKKSMNSRNSKNTGRGQEKNKKGASQKKKNNSGNKTKRNANVPRERSAARSETNNLSGYKSDEWTSVSSRSNRRQNNRRHSQPQLPQQQSQNRSRRAEGQGQDGQNDNGDNGRRRSHSRSRNRI
jgi:hypothetical protein